MVCQLTTGPSRPAASYRYPDAASQHRTEVKPGAFNFGSTIISAFHVGRIFGGGGGRWSDQLPQAVRASRSGDHPRTGWDDLMGSVNTAS